MADKIIIIIIKTIITKYNYLNVVVHNFQIYKVPCFIVSCQINIIAVIIIIRISQTLRIFCVGKQSLSSVLRLLWGWEMTRGRKWSCQNAEETLPPSAPLFHPLSHSLSLPALFFSSRTQTDTESKRQHVSHQSHVHHAWDKPTRPHSHLTTTEEHVIHKNMFNKPAFGPLRVFGQTAISQMSQTCWSFVLRHKSSPVVF